VRRLPLISVLAATAVLLSAASAATAPAARTGRVSVPGGITLTMPAGTHLVRIWAGSIADPVVRFAAATFAVRFASHPCECGTPNIAHFPRTGAFLFMWEYLSPALNNLKKDPRRPRRFRIGDGAIGTGPCSVPSEVFVFRDAGRAFQAEVYVGPDASPQTRAKLGALLDSLRATPAPG
jgi:hypothetical protein